MTYIVCVYEGWLLMSVVTFSYVIEDLTRWPVFQVRGTKWHRGPSIKLKKASRLRSGTRTLTWRYWSRSV